MLRNKPRLKYCGLTLVLSNPGRFDNINLLTATGGVFFNSYCLLPEFNQMQCDIRLMEDKSPWLENTKCILLLGQAAMHEYCPKETGNNVLNEMRGSPLYVDGIPAMATFFPQDCADIKNHEQSLNKESKEYTGDESEGNDDDGDADVKRFSHTKRSNYAFWAKHDVEKCKRLLTENRSRWPIENAPVYKIYSPAQEVIQELESHKNEYLYFDIETDYEEQNLLCFSFSFDGRFVYSVPILNTDYHYAYSALPLIIRGLIKAIKNNIIVAHNGAAFDFFVLGSKYHIPIYRSYDTMVAMHRCFPEVEMSLGHCTSYWTYQMFHKDTDSRSYRTSEDLMNKLKYCGKDVFTMFLIHKAITSYAGTVPGLTESINCANCSIRPYLITTLQGIRYSQEKVTKMCNEYDRLMMEYLRIIDILIGPSGMADCKKAVKGKAKAFPSSNAQCCEYFHNLLGYEVVYRSKKTQKPSLGKGAIYKLALLHKNPVITFVMLYRKIQKEYSALNFCPWKDDAGKIVDYYKWVEEHEQ